MLQYSIKMRASKLGKHISGAERIIEAKEIAPTLGNLAHRALHHDLGQADFINFKVEAIAPQTIQYLDALPVSSRPKNSIEESYNIMASLLQELGLEKQSSHIISLLRQVKPMRGAMLYDIATHQTLEPDHDRGIRVTYMDAAEVHGNSSQKNHFQEALILATKVAHAPGIIAELCISDDPNYVTGYLASKKHGYVRLTPLKELGDAHGGRIFIFDSTQAKVEDCINYLEKQRILVRGIPLERSLNQDPQEIFAEELEQLQRKSLYRSTKTINSPQSKYVDMRGRKLLLLASNSYLDFANDPRVKDGAVQAVQAWGAGSGGSRLTTGTNTLHERLEEKLAKFKHTEAALLFNTGYMANVGIISALCHKDSTIFSDEYNHASIIDGCRLSGARIVVYKHNDMADLEHLLATTAYRKGLIVSDAVFSMDGDIANLPAIVQLGRRYKLLTMVDEAHATGVIGATGRGIVEHYNNICQPDILMGTLSKALGAEGGYACSSKTIIDYLKNKARSFIFATSQAPATVGAALAALEILENEPEPVHQLQHNVTFFLKCLQQNGVQAESTTAIIPIIIGDAAAALQIAEELQQQGLFIPAIRYPTVPQGTARLRIALMSTHTEAELAHTAELIAQAITKYRF